jgi:hypothetical protein
MRCAANLAVTWAVKSDELKENKFTSLLRLFYGFLVYSSTHLCSVGKKKLLREAKKRAL